MSRSSQAGLAVALIWAAVTLVPSPGGAAQIRPRATIDPGERLRIGVTDGVHDGRLRAVVRDTIVLDGGRPPTTVSIALGDVRRIDVLRRKDRGRGAGALRGLGWGSLIGAAAGALIGAVTYDEPTLLSSDRGDSTLLGMIVFGVLGAGAGTAVGAGMPGTIEAWETLDPAIVVWPGCPPGFAGRCAGSGPELEAERG